MDTGSYMANQMDNLIESGIRWKDYLDELETKYKDIPFEIKREIVDRDYKEMFGWEYTGHDGMEFILAFDNALYHLSKTVKKNIVKRTAENVLIYNEFWAKQRKGEIPEGCFADFSEDFTKDWYERNDFWIKQILE